MAESPPESAFTRTVLALRLTNNIDGLFEGGLAFSSRFDPQLAAAAERLALVLDRPEFADTISRFAVENAGISKTWPQRAPAKSGVLSNEPRAHERIAKNMRNAKADFIKA